MVTRQNPNRHPHIESRNGIWTLRVRVPRDLRARVGLTEVRRSLGTDSLRHARDLAAQHLARLRELFELAKTTALENAEIQAIARNYYETLVPEAERFRPRTSDPAWERLEQAALAEEEITDLERQIAASSYKRNVARAVDDALSQRNLQLDELSATDANKLTNAIARALIENLRLFIHRLDEPLLPYEPTDPLVRNAPDATTTGNAPAPTPAEISSGVGPTIGALVEKYLSAKAASWEAKTLTNRRQKLALFVEHLGAEKRISDITVDDMRAFVAGLSRLRRGHHVGCDQSFLGRQTDNANVRVSDKTVALHAADVKSLFNWAKAHGYLKEPPVSGLVVDLAKRTKGEKARRPFTSAELVKLFSSPNFVGCKGTSRRFDTGPVVMRDAYFWIPVLGLYTGARLAELVQLHLDDVGTEGPISFIDINERNPPGIPGSRKHVKSEAGVRKIPLHPDLVELGFLDFVTARRKDKRARATHRLFFEVRYGADGQPSSAISKWFGRLMDSVGLTDPALVFHSFRHTVEDALRNAELHAYVINRVIGHDDNHVSGKYGQGASLEVAPRATSAWSSTTTDACTRSCGTGLIGRMPISQQRPPISPAQSRNVCLPPGCWQAPSDTGT